VSDAYILIDGVKGQSQDKDHKDWIELISYSQNLEQPINNPTAGTTGRRPQGRAQWEDLKIVKQEDKATPFLAHLCASGNYIKKAELHLMAAGAAGANTRNKFMKILIEDVYVSKYISRLDAGTNRPVEEVYLNFGKIKWEYTPDLVGKTEAAIIKGWDRDTNQDYT